MTARGWGYSSCVFSVQMFPLSLPNDLDIKSCRFPVVNLPRGTPGTCTAWLRLRPTPTSQNWHKISSQKNKHLDSIPYNNHKSRCSVLDLERSWQEGSGSLTNSPLSGRGRLFSLVSTRCLYYVLSSLILTFCKYFWISLLTVWRMRRIRSHLSPITMIICLFASRAEDHFMPGLQLWLVFLHLYQGHDRFFALKSFH